jgi:hypothetical protein
VRRTLTPRIESMAVEGNTLTLSRGGRTRTLALDSMPELLGMVEAMRGTLSGDGATLQRYFRSTVTGSPAKWTLDLVPLDRTGLRAQVRSMRISGRAATCSGLEMEFVGGDRSVMNITPGAAPAPSHPQRQRLYSHRQRRRPPRRPRPRPARAHHAGTAAHADGPPSWSLGSCSGWLLVLLCRRGGGSRARISAPTCPPSCPRARTRVNAC